MLVLAIQQWGSRRRDAWRDMADLQDETNIPVTLTHMMRRMGSMQGVEVCTACPTTELLAHALQGMGQPWQMRSRRYARWLSGVMPPRG